MQSFLPTLHNLLGAAGVAAGLLMVLLLGALATPRRTLPEVQLVAGWGLTCLILTTWGVFVAATLLVPLAVLGAIGALCLAHPHLRGRIGPLSGAGRLMLLSLPLWLVMLPLRPSQVDTWLNLLPNAAYLFDHGRLPTETGPPNYSFLPGAPYNTQFLAFAASEASGAFADSAMALFNVALMCASGLLLARAVAGRASILPWWACATGLLLAIPLNPGFVPRTFFASYGEASLAVTAMLAVWLAVEVASDLARGIAWPRASAGLALVLAALVNIKQSGIGLLLSVGLSLLVLVVAHPRIPFRRAIGAIVVALLPALVLELIWRAFVLNNFAAGELKPLSIAAWNIGLLPQIASSMAREAYDKATFFLFVAAVLGAAAWQWRRHPWSHRGLLVGMAAGMIVLFNGFLVVTYVVLFPADMAADAHSYFRYASQLSLTVMLALTVALRPFARRLVASLGTRACHAATASVVLILAVPPAIAGMLRFDLDPPQPLLWDLGHQVARRVLPGDRLALLVPGDVNDSVGSMLRGVILFTPPRRPELDIATKTRADSATLDTLAASGYTLALVSCTSTGLDGTPPDAAALLRRTADGWRPVEVWPYPADITRWRFAALLARAPLCAVRPAH